MSDEQKDAAAQLYNEAKTTDSPSEESTAEQAEGGEESQQQEGAQGDQGESQEKPEAEGEQSSDEEKKGEETKEAGAPENYELILPKKTQLQSEDIDRIAAYARERGLSNEQAQEIVKIEHDAIEKFVTVEADRLRDLSQKEWVNQTKNDKEIGGEAYGKNIEMAKRVVTKFADEKLINELDVTGFGNHPELVRMLVRIGKQMAEDSLVVSKAQQGPKKSMEELFYGA